MSWESFFETLEDRFQAAIGARDAEEHIEATRARFANTKLVDRLRQHDQLVVVSVRGVQLRLVVESVGPDWIAGIVGADRSRALVPVSALAWSTSSTGNRVTNDEAAQPCHEPANNRPSRAPWAVVLREFARRRTPIELRVAGERCTGTIDRVLADHLELALHPLDVPRRATAVVTKRWVQLAAIESIHWRT